MKSAILLIPATLFLTSCNSENKETIQDTPKSPEAIETPVVKNDYEKTLVGKWYYLSSGYRGAKYSEGLYIEFKTNREFEIVLYKGSSSSSWGRRFYGIYTTNSDHIVLKYTHPKCNFLDELYKITKQENKELELYDTQSAVSIRTLKLTDKMRDEFNNIPSQSDCPSTTTSALNIDTNKKRSIASENKK